MNTTFSVWVRRHLTRLLAPILLGLAAAPASAQTPTVEQIQALQLPDGFTLTYTAVETDVRSPELKAARAADIRRDYQTMVTHGNCTQAQADRMVRIVQGGENAPSPPKQYQVTLSGRDGKLLCISRERAGKEYATDMNGVAHPLPLDDEVVLYDGHKTYDYSSQSQRMTVQPGRGGMSHLLLPGVGLPGLPLVKPPLWQNTPQAPAADAGAGGPSDGGLACALVETRWFSPGSPDALYQPGEVYAAQNAGLLQVTRAATTDGSGRPLQEWRYDRPRRLGDVWLARRVHSVENEIGADGLPSPARVLDFTVGQATAQALPAGKFDVRTYLPPGTGIYEGNAYHFRYDPKGGDLETQRRVQTARQAADAKKRQQFDDEIRADRSDHGDGSNGNALLAAAQAQARREGKAIFLVFHASWCGPCFMLHRFLNDPQVKPLIQAHYVVVEEDVWEHGKNAWENPGAQALFQKYGGRHAIPFYAVLTPGGRKLGDSLYGPETMGVPSNAGQEKAFLGLFGKAAPGLLPSDKAALKAAIERNTVMH